MVPQVTEINELEKPLMDMGIVFAYGGARMANYDSVVGAKHLTKVFVPTNKFQDRVIMRFISDKNGLLRDIEYYCECSTPNRGM